MSFLADFRAERMIARLLRAKDLDSAESLRLRNKLKALGQPAVERLLRLLPEADESRLKSVEWMLEGLLDQSTLPLILSRLGDAGQRGTARIMRLLSHGRGYDPHRLAEAFSVPELPKAPLIQILTAQKDRLDGSTLLRIAHQLQPADRNALFQVIELVADSAMIPELINRASGKDPGVRQQVVRVLGRFDTPEARKTLEACLKDADKGVRQAAMAALVGRGVAVDLASLCDLLRDPDMNIQEQAVDAVIRRHDPATMTHLLPILRDESEYVRRAGVEVLNSIGTAHDVKQLLTSVKDEDWWVRARAADALARIGGPRVVKAVVELLRDDDEFIRRSAVEILNATRDEGALEHLMVALDDSDWWVRERAVDALGDLGHQAAVPVLIDLMERDTKAAPAVIRALAKLKDDRAVEPLLKQLAGASDAVRVDAVQALGQLADSSNVQRILQAIERHASGTEGELEITGRDVSARLGARFALTGGGAAVMERTLLTDDVTSMLGDDTGGGVTGTVRKMPGTPRAPTQAALDLNALEPGDMLGDRYRFVRRVGKGAFGTVLLMDDTMISETIILKVMNPQLAADEEMIKRFIQELRLSRKITHENVIRIHDFLVVQGALAISMEYFPSATLGAILQKTNPLPVVRALRYAEDIAAGMSAAHDVGVIHRDLKPGNVLINSRDVLKIVDFGVAAVTGAGDTRLTRTGILIGTPKYMAPEQVLGKPVSVRSDIYALGVLLYEMLAGRPPFLGEDQVSIMYQHVQGQAVPLPELNPAIDPALAEVVARMMAVDPEARYQSMAQVREVLHAQN
ncbi:HEAT repeat domain-containing protein [Ectothiorhodospira lacustris]|uniref:HEAT repeat domain-containing protein n=1 Tax=Ectothiorhodospira lacustris TaxID=2899127 RepID=UPI001EE960BA|nr:HEAT repeat domain-containing protein [Ectothiorhodospira lacustris]MCG5501647.1 HEAT repeat domain-containing protein [Ectothiorhodospira lacustris]MCG5509899.1 HEAT repeat domain-containing protein [Ectothiorhodospira lacustris]MCG5521152.1 HEAT repeat domain-containing protein [Ectothiorhodospira lacustris]